MNETIAPMNSFQSAWRGVGRLIFEHPIANYWN